MINYFYNKIIYGYSYIYKLLLNNNNCENIIISPVNYSLLMSSDEEDN
jgi:hypothetical protein